MGRWWLAPMALPLAAPLLVLWRRRSDPLFSTVLLAAGSLGAVCFLAQGFLIGIGGWEYPALEGIFGPLGDRQYGMGYGALLVSAAFLFLFAQGLAARGAINGDGFVLGSIALVIALVAAFIFFPVVSILASAFQDNDYNFIPYLFVEKLFSRDIWGVGCLTANVNCGVAWNSLLMAHRGRREHDGPGTGFRPAGNAHRFPGQKTTASP